MAEFVDKSGSDEVFRVCADDVGSPEDALHVLPGITLNGKDKWLGGKA